MSSQSGSVKVILIALFANVGIALAKFAGAFISGSAALLAEGIHSLVDCTNQVLLLVGEKRSGKPPTEEHPLGFARESFFWSFVVAILLFSLGGLFAIYEGIHKLNDPHEITNPGLAIGILALGIVLEGFSFFACLKEVRHTSPGVPLWRWYRRTTRAGLLVIFTEDLGALLGLTMAAGCVTVAWVLDDPAWDAFGSILVGALLVILAVVLATEVKSLIIGEAPQRNYRHEIEAIIREYLPGSRIFNFIALKTGDREVMLSVKIHPGTIERVSDLIKAFNQIEDRIGERFPEIKWKFLEPDDQEDIYK